MFETFENWTPTVLWQSGPLTPRKPAALGHLHSTGCPLTESDGWIGDVLHHLADRVLAVRSAESRRDRAGAPAAHRLP